MVPSFSPMMQARLAQLGQPNPATTRDPDSGLEVKTLASLIDDAKKHRFVDDPGIFYDALVGGERSNPLYSPFTANHRAYSFANKVPVAVIGGGMSGLLTTLQLVKAGIGVRLMEALPDPSENGGRAGRVWPINISDGDEATKQQLGAMRFPTSAYLFWHYMRVCGAASDQTLFKAFPNPGAVPTLFRAEASAVSAYWTYRC